MTNRDRFGHVIPEMEKEIMAHFDTTIRGDFGNTAEILQAASEDLSAENATAAAEDYGRTATNKFKKLCESLPCETHWEDNLTPAIAEHIYDAARNACDCREAAFKAQIERMIEKGDLMASRLKWLSYSADLHNHVVPWNGEAIRARELIK